ncbi:GNAT family N-acetyltransferase [Streptomyces sp. NPDC059575]|uniref:GNAT family N-acetyltransferase n=1 Tax=Streptomyces sp. NPDC059575 TaxID=3346872 RepID=UPI0036B2FD71
MTQPLIRAARPEDEAGIVLLDRLTWSTLHSVQPEPGPPDAAFFGERHPPENHLAAELDGRLVGYIRICQPIPLPVNAHVRQIQGIAVAEEARGLGVGRALVRGAVELARRQGARRLTLRVLGHNTPARRLYEAEGFKIEGVFPEEFLIAGEYVDDVCMGRPV